MKGDMPLPSGYTWRLTTVGKEKLPGVYLCGAKNSRVMMTTATTVCFFQSKVHALKELRSFPAYAQWKDNLQVVYKEGHESTGSRQGYVVCEVFGGMQ